MAHRHAALQVARQRPLEVRSDITDGIARVIFFLQEGKLVIVNGFVKKTQKTPDAEIELAKKRKKETES